MSDFPARAFKWTEIMSLIFEHSKRNNDRNLKNDLWELRQYAIKKYKADPEIADKFLQKYDALTNMGVILNIMFGEP